MQPGPFSVQLSLRDMIQNAFLDGTETLATHQHTNRIIMIEHQLPRRIIYTANVFHTPFPSMQLK